MDLWSISRNKFDSKQNLSDEGLFAQGSGYLHIRGSLEEPLLNDPQNKTYLRTPGNVTVEKFSNMKSKCGTYIPGIFGKHPLLNNEMINLPNFLGLILEADGEKFSLEKSEYTDYFRNIDFRNGLLTRAFKWQTKSEKTIKVNFERFVSLTEKHLCVQRLIVECDDYLDFNVESIIDSDIRTSGFDHLINTQFTQHDESVLCRNTTDSGIEIAIYSKLQSEHLHEITFEEKGRSAILKSSFKCLPGKRVVIEKRTVLSSSIDIGYTAETEEIYIRRTKSYLKKNENVSFDILLKKHTEVWKNRWEKCDVVIEGDSESQLAMRLSLYHLIRTHVPNDCRVAIDAKGYAGDAYFGRFFWDTEVYMLPFYLYTDPERAKTFTDFRIQSLKGAKANAAKYGSKGARYAWESDSDGYEGCPLGNWQYSDHEIHVTGAVVYGLYHFAKASGIDYFKNNEAKNVLLETARYWVDRVDWRKNDNYPSLLGVMGPDEYTPISNNNSYTNRIAKFNLMLAAEYSDCDDTERNTFYQISEELPILKKNGLVLQCEEFEKLAEPDFGKNWIDLTKPFGAQVHQEKLYRSKCLKQADVLMMMFLFPKEFTENELKAAWEYYIPYCTHDSSLSGGIHAILALKLDLKEDAYKYWKKCSVIDLNDGAAQGIHIANAASNWMVAVQGFAGMKTVMDSETFSISPKLPDNWEKLSFPIVWKGIRLNVEISKKDIKIINRSAVQLKVNVKGMDLQVAPNEEKVINT